MKNPGARAVLLATLALLMVILPGCGGILIDTRHIIEEIEANPGKGSFIRDVPFYPQDRYACGPASLASLVAYWGVASDDIDETIAGVYQARLKGTLPIDMLLFAKEKGMEAVYYKGGLDDVREKVSGKEPLILFLNLGLESYPVGHYIVVVGYDDVSGMVIAHSGMDKERVYTYGELERAWSKTGYSTLLIKPRGGRR